MRILQIATLVTPDGAYGGPIRVAVNQTRALLEAGHDVTLAAAASGFRGPLPRVFDGVPVRLFRALPTVPGVGFSGTNAPALQQWLMREAVRADAVHIHLGRDLVTLPCPAISRLRGVPYVVQTHGMVMPSNHPLSSITDRLWTRPALQKAARVFYLTDEEKLGLQEVGGSQVRLERLVNGVPLPAKSSVPEQDLEVLFLARLQARKRPLMFVEMAARLHERFPSARFSIVGPDEGEGSAIREKIALLGLSNAVKLEGALEPSEVSNRVSQSAIYVLPSVDEPFPMTVLEAMAMGRPVVVTETCGLAEYIADAGAGAVVNSSLESLVNAVSSLIEDPELRRQAGRNANLLVENKLSMEPVSSQLSSVYGEVLTTLV